MTPLTPAASAAAEAAVKVAASLGVRGTDPVILADGANVIVHLSPAPVVAKVAASTTVVRPEPAAWLQRELDVTRFLAGRGAPVAVPSPEVPATVHHGDGQVMSFWRYVDSSGALPSAGTVGAMLRDLHAALRDYPGQAPVLAPLGDIPAFLARPHTILTAAQAAALAAAYARLTAELIPHPAQPLHGDAGVGNLMATGAGWVWHHFEDTCPGPVAWDLAASTASQRLDGSRILAAYGAPRGPSPARGLPAAQAPAPDRLVRPVHRTAAPPALPNRRTPGYVAGALTERGCHTAPRRLVSGQ